MAHKSKLLIEQRRRRMLDLVGQDGQATVAELAKIFSISAVTARGDLDALASLGSIVRSHGGAVRRLDATQDYPLRTKEALHHDEKCRIGRAAAELVRAGRNHHSGFRHNHHRNCAAPEDSQDSAGHSNYQCFEYRC